MKRLCDVYVRSWLLELASKLLLAVSFSSRPLDSSSFSRMSTNFLWRQKSWGEEVSRVQLYIRSKVHFFTSITYFSLWAFGSCAIVRYTFTTYTKHIFKLPICIQYIVIHQRVPPFLLETLNFVVHSWLAVCTTYIHNTMWKKLSSPNLLKPKETLGRNRGFSDEITSQKSINICRPRT